MYLGKIMLWNHNAYRGLALNVLFFFSAIFERICCSDPPAFLISKFRSLLVLWDFLINCNLYFLLLVL